MVEFRLDKNPIFICKLLEYLAQFFQKFAPVTLMAFPLPITMTRWLKKEKVHEPGFKLALNDMQR